MITQKFYLFNKVSIRYNLLNNNLGIFMLLLHA